MEFRIQTLGRSGITGASGNPIDFPIGKTWCVLVYLAVERRPVPRSEIRKVFWAEADRSRGRHSVRQALFDIRQRLGDVVFSTSDDPVRVDDRAVQVDLHELVSEEDSTTLDDVIALYGGPFLSGVTLRDSPSWDRWVDDQNIRAASAFARSLIRIGDSARSRGDFTRAIRALNLAIDAEPFRTEAHRALVETLVLQGDLEGAEAAILRAAESASLDAVHDLGDLRRTIAKAREASPSRGESPEWIPRFVDRQKEIGALFDRWRRVESGRRQVVHIRGEVGGGKTRLAREFGARIRGLGGRVIYIDGTVPEATIPFNVLADLASALYRMPGAAGISPVSESVVSALLPSLSRPAGEPVTALEPVSLADAVTDLIEAVAYEAPLLLILDDVHWLDESSRSLLRRIFKQLDETPVLFLMLSRDESWSGGQRWLKGAPDFTLELQPFNIEAVEALVVRSTATESTGDPERWAAPLHRVSQGNPAFLIELLHALHNGDDLQRLDVSSIWPGTPTRDRYPHRAINEVVSHRLSGLRHGPQNVLRHLALAGRPLSVKSFERRLGDAPDELARDIDRLLERGIITCDKSGRFDFCHPAFRDAVGHRRARLRRVIAAALIMVVSALAAGAVILGRTGPLFGGGTIYLLNAKGLEVMEVTGDQPERWDAREPEFSVPVAPELRDLSPDGSGGLLFWGYQMAPGGPDVLRLLPDGRAPVVLVDEPGDDGWAAASPDGSHFLYTSENLETPHYDHHLYRMGIDGKNPVRIRGGDSWLSFTDWSPSGRRILFTVRGGADTIFVANPNGDVLAEREFSGVLGARWCGVDAVLVVAQGQPAPLLVHWKVDSGRVDTLTTNLVPGRPACSPDGSASIFRAIRDGKQRLVLREHEPGKEHDLGSIATRQVYWFPQGAAVVPHAVEITSAADTLAWGSRKPAHALVRMTDGELRSMPDVELTSADPNVASVAEGTVFGNNPGSTKLVATLDGWLADTVQVEVTGDPSVAPLLQDMFRSWSEEDWIAFGEPKPRATGAALAMRGDGSYSDGIVTRETFDIAKGVTAELEFRLPITRRDRQAIALSIARAQILEGRDGDKINEWVVGSEIRAIYPDGELQKFDPAVARFEFQRVPVPTISEPPDSAWHHLAVQIRPDGYAELFVDRTFAARSIQRFDTSAGRAWRVRILGRSAGTQLLIRNFLLWPVTRYLPEDEPAARSGP